MRPRSFEKISWVYEIPEVFSQDALSTNVLGVLSENAQRNLVYSIMTTLMRYFNCSNAFTENYKNEEEKVEQFSNQAMMWMSGLRGVSVAQIVHALDDILELRTDYQKYPPKSVMEFRAVCRMPRPAYHDVPKEPANCLQLEHDKEAVREKTVKTAHECLSKIYQQLRGKDYDEVHEQKKKNGNYGKEMQEEWGKEHNCSVMRRVK